MVGRGLLSGGGDEPFTGRSTIGYDHGYDGELFYLGSALDPAYTVRGSSRDAWRG